MKKLTLTISALTLLALAAGILWYQKVYMPSHEQNAVAQRVCSEPGMRTFSHAGLAFCYPESEEEMRLLVNTDDFSNAIVGSFSCGNTPYKFQGKIFAIPVSLKIIHSGPEKIFNGQIRQEELGPLAIELGIQLPTEENEILSSGANREIAQISDKKVVRFFVKESNVKIDFSVKTGNIHVSEQRVMNLTSNLYAFFVGNFLALITFHEPICDRNAIEKIVASFHVVD